MQIPESHRQELLKTDPTGEDCVYTNNYNSDGTVGVERGNCSQNGGTFVSGTIDMNSLTTRLTNAFSKKIENHAAAVALGYFAHNTSPAMAAGVTTRLWEVSDLVALWEAEERELERAA